MITVVPDSLQPKSRQPDSFDKDVMRITIKLIGPLIYEAGFSEKVMRLPAGTTTGELIARVKIEKNRPVIITRNGRMVAPNDALKDGDRVVISHIYSGG